MVVVIYEVSPFVLAVFLYFFAPVSPFQLTLNFGGLRHACTLKNLGIYYEDLLL